MMSLILTARCQRQGLQGVVWSWAGLRIARYAYVRYRVLQSGYCSEVSHQLSHTCKKLTGRPYDCRMWTALATVYEGLQR
jgi:hypothetical protein